MRVDGRARRVVATGPLITYGAMLWPGLLVAALIAWQVMACFYMSADSAAFVELGRSLASGHGYTFNEEPFFGYPPVFPAVLALGILIFGDSVLMMRIVVALSAGGFLAASYFLMRRLVSWRAALFAVWCFGLSAVLADWMPYLMADMTGALVGTLALLAILRVERTDKPRGRFGWPTALAVALTVLAVLTRTAYVALAGAVVLSAFILRRDRLSRGTLRTMLPIVVAVLACVAIWFSLRFTSGSPFHRMPYLPLLESHKDWDSGYLGPLGLASRTVESVPVWLAIFSRVLFVGASSVSRWVGWVLVGLFLLGLGVGFVRRRGLVEAFTLAVLVLPLGTPFAASGARYYIVIGPLAFMYVYEAVAWLGGLTRRLGPRPRVAIGYALGGVGLLVIVLMFFGTGPLGGSLAWFADWRRAIVALAFAGGLLVALGGDGRWTPRRLFLPATAALLVAVWAAVQLGTVVPQISLLRKAERGHDMIYEHAEIGEIARRLRTLAAPGDTCVSSEPRLYRGLTGLRAYRFPFTRDQNRVLEALKLGDWIVLDLRLRPGSSDANPQYVRPEDATFARPVIEAHPDLFRREAEAILEDGQGRVQLYRHDRRQGLTGDSST
jgi:4-amino-4-deoxy-L-arabinose transferase-like glycosyltransferase